MTLVSERALVTPVLLALVFSVAACAQAEDPAREAATHEPASSSSAAETPAPQPEPEQRTDSERQFLDELTGFGLPTGMSAETTIEVGIGICESIADGATTDTILDHIRPLSSAIAAQSDDHDNNRVGLAIVEASRSHLCD